MFLPFAAGPRGEGLWPFAAAGALGGVLGLAAGLLILGLSMGVLLAAGTLLAIPETFLGHARMIAFGTSLCLMPALVALRLLPPIDAGPALDMVPFQGAVRLFLEAAYLPLWWLFGLVLHGYLALVLLAGALPSGVIGPFVVAFGAAFLLGWHLAWPWRRAGAPHVRLFFRFGLILVLLPLAMLAWALRERVLAYGWTESRLLLALLALWLAAWALSFSLRPLRLPLRGLLLSLSAVLLLAVGGPLMLRDLAVGAQAQRLRGLHATAPKEGREADRADAAISGSVRFLAERQALERVRDLLPAEAAASAGGDPRSFVHALGRRYWEGSEGEMPVQRLSFAALDRELPWRVSGYDVVLLGIHLRSGEADELRLDERRSAKIRLSDDLRRLEAGLTGADPLLMTLPSPIDGAGGEPIELKAATPSGSHRVVVRITEMMLERTPDRPPQGSLWFHLAVAWPDGDGPDDRNR